MRITFSNTLLAASDLALGRVGPAGLSWSGSPIVEVAQFFRADFATVYGRGDGPEDFSFSVWRIFSTEAAALVFAGTHRASLPVQADLALVDDDGTAALVMAGAVREARIDQVFGVAVHVSYKFTGAHFVAETVPDAPPDDSTMKTGTITLSVDDTSAAVVFAVPFSAAPSLVDARLSVPTSADDGFSAWPVEDSITAAGFTVKLGGIVPSAGYKLRWTAQL